MLHVQTTVGKVYLLGQDQGLQLEQEESVFSKPESSRIFRHL